MRNLGSLVLLGSSLLAFGCAKQSTDSTDSAADAVDSSDAVESEGNVMMAFSDGADGGAAALAAPLDAPTAAANIKANIPLRWVSCHTAPVITQVSPTELTVQLDDCTGPRGLLHVSGTIDLTISYANGVISVNGTSTDLTVNGAQLDFTVMAQYSVSGTTHTLSVQTTGQGTGPRGAEIDHNGAYTITWDTNSQCGSIDGKWSTEFSTSVASATRSNEVNLMRCAGGCPTGTLVHDFLGGQSLTVTFDGSNVATWSTSGGKSGTVNLLCQ